jgi:hypothetical protein
MSATDGVEGGDDALSKAQLHEVSAAVVSVVEATRRYP